MMHLKNETIHVLAFIRRDRHIRRWMIPANRGGLFADLDAHFLCFGALVLLGDTTSTEKVQVSARGI